MCRMICDAVVPKPLLIFSFRIWVMKDKIRTSKKSLIIINLIVQGNKLHISVFIGRLFIYPAYGNNYYSCEMSSKVKFNVTTSLSLFILIWQLKPWLQHEQKITPSPPWLSFAPFRFLSKHIIYADTKALYDSNKHAPWKYYSQEW